MTQELKASIFGGIYLRTCWSPECVELNGQKKGAPLKSALGCLVCTFRFELPSRFEKVFKSGSLCIQFRLFLISWLKREAK